MEYKPHLVTLLHKTLQWLPITLKIKSKVLPWTTRLYMIWPLVSSAVSSPITLAISHACQSLCPPCCSTAPSNFRPLDLLCPSLECSSPRSLCGSFPHFILEPVTFSKRLSLGILSKITVPSFSNPLPLPVII